MQSGPLPRDSEMWSYEVKWDGPNRRSTVLASFRAVSVGKSE